MNGNRPIFVWSIQIFVLRGVKTVFKGGGQQLDTKNVKKKWLFWEGVKLIKGVKLFKGVKHTFLYAYNNSI